MACDTILPPTGIYPIYAAEGGTWIDYGAGGLFLELIQPAQVLSADMDFL